MEFNKRVQEMSNKRRRLITDRWNGEKPLVMREFNEYRYLQKTEDDFVNLLKKSEPIDANLT